MMEKTPATYFEAPAGLVVVADGVAEPAVVTLPSVLVAVGVSDVVEAV